MSESAVVKRLQSELFQLMTNPVDGVSAFPSSEDDLKQWTATLVGPKSTVYENLSFTLSLSFPSNYPYSAPNVKFISRIFHPNVDLVSGTICLDILKDKWSAIYNVQTGLFTLIPVLISLQSLLGEPNNDSPLNSNAANLWGSDAEFRNQVVCEFNKGPQ